MKDRFQDTLVDMTSRILSQVCRDPGSRFYGSCDRNWWHYKIRDFSSIILQQAGYYLYQCSVLDMYSYESEAFKQYAVATVDFWASRAVKHGAFEEYYPWEGGYPALAFSTLGSIKLILLMGLDSKKYYRALQIAASQLLDREEHEATNQYVAGIAALFYINKVYPDLVHIDQAKNRLKDILRSQSEEGWFLEYGGPDLGYLSVAVDCLWDIYDIHVDESILACIAKAISFMDSVIIGSESIGQHNARNTDYIVPYGIFRAVFNEQESLSNTARSVAMRIFGRIRSAEHFWRALDDRYICHYSGHSLARAYALLCRHDWPSHVTSHIVKTQLFSESGYYVLNNGDIKGIISTKKGGILSVATPTGAEFNDYGWQFDDGESCFVTNWWGASVLDKVEGGTIQISGSFVKTREQNSNPFSHLTLRIVSYIFGKSIISILKKQMIFRASKLGYRFNRAISFDESHIVIIDQIYGLKDESLLLDAPVFSRRHVASAESFNSQNIALSKNCQVNRKITKKFDAVVCECNVVF